MKKRKNLSFIKEEKTYQICKRAYYELFKKESNQIEILQEISKDISIFELISLPRDLMIALIGIGTLKSLDKDNTLTFRSVYTEILLKALEYIKENKKEQQDSNINNIKDNKCKVIYLPKQS